MIEVGVADFISDPGRDQRAAQDPGRDHRQAQSDRRRDHQGAGTQARFQELDLTPGGGSPADMAKAQEGGTERWTAVIHAAGIQPDKPPVASCR